MNLSRWGRGVAVSIVVLVLLVALVRVSRRPGNTVYLGGQILTMDAENRVVEALAVEGERIAAVGDEAELRAWATANDADIVDLEGRALLPGFIDAHGHFPGAGITAVFVDLGSPPINEVVRIEDIVERLAERAERTSPGDWILGVGYDDTLLEERRHPRRRDLNRASTEHPIAVLHISGHMAATNDAGLEALGITPATPNPPGGRIQRDPETGEPNGVLEETAMDAIQGMLTPGLMQGLAILRAGTARYLEQGVTTAQSGATAGGLIQLLSWMSKLGAIPVRLVIWPTGEAASAMLAGELEPPDVSPLSARIGAVKLIADGSIQGYTGYLREPYAVPPGDDPGYRGYPRIERSDLIEQVEKFHAAGLQLAVHGNGDAAIDDILDAFEAALERHPRSDARHIVIHSQMARDDQLDRMRDLGVIPSFFSLHTFYWGDRHRTLFMGPERAARMSPAQSALDRGIRFTIHADTPVVPMEPMRLVWSAVNRQTRSGVILGPEQRITPMQALRAVTIDAARQHFEEDLKGSLEPGKLADLVILSRSPLEEPATLDEVEIIETVIGGRTVYRAAAD